MFFFVSIELNFISTAFFFKSYVTIAPPHPPASIHVYLHYSGRGRGSPATNQPPPPEYLLTRVQWFWHFFRNSICFMCFWFGLEILRLIYIKVFFWNIEWFLSYLTFYPSKKTAPPLIRIEKKFLWNWACRVSKEAEFFTDLKNVQESLVWQKGKIYLQTNWIFRDLENFAKNRFSE